MPGGATSYTGPGLRRLELTDTTNSQLFDKLCAPASSGGPCTFPSEVVLTAHLQCTGTGGECASDTLRVLSVVDSTGTRRYYEYKRRPCVQLSLFANPKR